MIRQSPQDKAGQKRDFPNAPDSNAVPAAPSMIGLVDFCGIALPCVEPESIRCLNASPGQRLLLTCYPFKFEYPLTTMKTTSPRTAQTALAAACLLMASMVISAEEAKRIEDNSFLLEEAYNQEPDVIQYIQAYQYSKKTKTWSYTFTNEIPVPNQTHQFSYTVPLSRVGDDPSFQTGLGDIALNYRYQLINDAGVALSPRFSVILPTGKYKKGLGNGATGYQINIPLSVDLAERWVSHWNLGVTHTPNARAASGIKADIRGTNHGASLVYLHSENLNFLVEYVRNENQAIQPGGSKVWEKSAFLNPGLRYAKNYESGWQMVSGVSFPIGVGPSRKDNGILLYLSFEK